MGKTRIIRVAEVSYARQLTQLFLLNPGACFRKADLHVHTPASSDIHESWLKATPQDLVALALEAELEVIAITDHNSAAWCDAMTAAAANTGLTVFPGVELSTPEGHLLAIFEVGTPQASIEEFLVQVGIGKDSWGKLDVATKEHIEEICRRIDGRRGVAIAAHIDGNKGFLKAVAVGAFGRRTQREPPVSTPAPGAILRMGANQWYSWQRWSVCHINLRCEERTR